MGSSFPPLSIEKLVAARQRKGWLQADLVRASGVTDGHLSQIENGQRRPRPSTIRKLADALGVDIMDLVGDKQL